ncbi:MAG: cardiolipin synthase [Verrucomicrobiales bacterium]|nr:cardiolipin synthase [Verrucomicrobiales bacterium]
MNLPPELFEQDVQRFALGTLFLIVWEILAVATIISVVMRARSAAGAWGWSMAMLAFPFIAVPLYWILGRQQFNGYIEKLATAQENNERIFHELAETLDPHFAKLEGENLRYGGVLERLSERRWTEGNEVCLLFDGKFIFDSIFKAMEKAEEYILVQFFIVKDDKLGERLRSLLLEKAKAGVRIYFVYDEIGSHKLSRYYVQSLRDAGVEIHAFHSTQGPSNRFQINFRNHRKIVVVDGRVGFVGGANVGDEYVERTDKYGEWRDTQVQLTGPSVLSLQMVFLSDYYWAAGSVPELKWTQISAADGSGCGAGESKVITLPTGPVERVEGGTIFFLNAITRARRRIWIASPYFVTDESIRSALQMAALRGADVRVMIPQTPDKWIPWLATFSYFEEMEAAGVRIFRFQPGFLHQKVFLVDESFSSVGTANLDNRSMRLNFEVSAVVLCPEFAKSVETMLEGDFARCHEVFGTDYTEKPWWFRVLVKLSRLASPVL